MRGSILTMKTSQKNARHHADAEKLDREVRPAVKMVVVAGCLICVILMAVHLVRGISRQHVASSQTGDTTEPQPAKSSTDSLAKSQRAKPDRSHFARASQSAASSYYEPPPEIRQVMEALARLNPTDGLLTDEEAAAWKDSLEKLIQQGDAAIPAIRDFLAKNWDVALGPKDREKIGYASVRLAMLNALMQINSSQAVTALDEELQTTSRPQEIAQVTQFLEKTDPGAYLQHALTAVQRALDGAARGNLDQTDVAPLFQVLLQFKQGNDKQANDYAIDVLKRTADQWNYYTATALAQLPDGAGIPTLVQIATGQTGGSGSTRNIALGALAGMASQSADAQEVLVNAAFQNNLSSYDWQILVPYLAGYQMIYQSSDLPENTLSLVNPNDLKKTMVSASNQSFYLAPLGALTTSQIDAQMAFIDKLLTSTADSGAIKAMQQAKSMLQSRRMLLADSSHQ